MRTLQEADDAKRSQPSATFNYGKGREPTEKVAAECELILLPTEVVKLSARDPLQVRWRTLKERLAQSEQLGHATVEAWLDKLLLRSSTLAWSFSSAHKISRRRNRQPLRKHHSRGMARDRSDRHSVGDQCEPAPPNGRDPEPPAASDATLQRERRMSEAPKHSAQVAPSVGSELPGTRKLTAEVDAPKFITLLCFQCGRTFQAPRKARGRHRRICSPACRRARAANPRRPRSRPKNYDFECAICGAPFATHNPLVRCCSRACGTRLAISTKRAKSIAKRAADAAANGGSDKSATTQLNSSVPRHEQTSPSPAQAAAARQGVAERVRQSAAQGRSGLVSNAPTPGLASRCS